MKNDKEFEAIHQKVRSSMSDKSYKQPDRRKRPIEIFPSAMLFMVFCILGMAALILVNDMIFEIKDGDILSLVFLSLLMIVCASVYYLIRANEVRYKNDLQNDNSLYNALHRSDELFERGISNRFAEMENRIIVLTQRVNDLER